MKKLMPIIAVCAVLILTGCQSTKTQRVETNSVTDVGTKWNDTDSRLVAEKMIEDVLSRGWLKQYYRKHDGKNPTVIIGTIKNRSHEHINVKTFIRNLEMAMLNSGQVDFVADKKEREQIRDERLDQASNASEDSAKYDGEEIGADYMLQGELNSLVNKDGGKAVKFYQVNLTLIDLEKNRKVWIGERKIKKLLEQSRFSF